MSYFRVGQKADSLAYFVWADNAQHAVRKVEAFAGEAMLNGRSLYISTPAKAEDVPEGDDVVDEPEMEREARTDSYEVEDAPNTGEIDG